MATFLFTAFEPSGDAHAAPVIAELARRHPDAKIYALGGERCREAGAELLESTTDRAAMLTSALGQIGEHRRRLKRLKAWLDVHPVDMLVPVDSPAANWSVCKAVRRAHPTAKIVHLVAPQLWAWAPWRVRKLRRLTDHVLCLLPFEPDWFGQRDVPCTFIGHPIVEETSPTDVADEDAPPRLAVLPGSRAAEIESNGPTMLTACRRLADTVDGFTAEIAVRDQAAADKVMALADGELPPETSIVIGETEAVLGRATAALVASGTASLQVAAAGVPLVVMYNVSWIGWQLLGRWLVRTRTFCLPNLIAEAEDRPRPVDEFIPHFGDPDPIIEALIPLLTEAEARDQRREALARVREGFAGHDFATEAADAIEVQLQAASAH